MPVLVLNLPNTPPRGLVLGERAIIGRRPFNTLIVPDPAVSRLHAWIGRRGAGYILFDAGSRSGSTLNDQRVTAPTPLEHGDRIQIGSATITFLKTDQLPEDVAPIQPPPPRPAVDPYDGGIYFDCACGGPMWVAAEHAGAAGKCRYCGANLVVPHRSGQTARPATPAGDPPPSPARRPPPEPRPKAIAQTTTPNSPGPERVQPNPRPPIAPLAKPRTSTATAVAEEEPAEFCSICQSEIHSRDDRTSCPSCNLSFHTQCWKENLGCSAYGCDQVNVLAAAKTESPAEQAYDANYDPGEAGLADESQFPWDSVLLALSFVAMALGAIAYGLPSAATLLIAASFLLSGRARRKGLAMASIAVSVVGIAAGYAMSMFWWQGQRVWERFVRL
jgi:hypothetical protein